MLKWWGKIQNGPQFYNHFLSWSFCYSVNNQKTLFKQFDWLHTHCTWSNWTRAASAVPSANERWARDALSPRGRLRCLSSSGRAASESWHLQGEGEDAKRITSYTRYDLITCGKPLSYHGVIKKKKLFMLRVGREIKSNTSFRGDQNLYTLCFFS